MDYDWRDEFNNLFTYNCGPFWSNGRIQSSVPKAKYRRNHAFDKSCAAHDECIYYSQNEQDVVGCDRDFYDTNVGKGFVRDTAAKLVIRLNKHFTKPVNNRQIMRYDPFPLEFTVSPNGTTAPINPRIGGHSGDPGRPTQLPYYPPVPQMVPVAKQDISQRTKPTTKISSKQANFEKTTEVDDNTNTINNKQDGPPQGNYTNVQSLSKLLNKTNNGKNKNKKKRKTKKKPPGSVTNDYGSRINRK